MRLRMLGLRAGLIFFGIVDVFPLSAEMIRVDMPVVVSFPSPPAQQSVLPKSPTGGSDFRLTLVPDKDVSGRAVVLILVMNRTDTKPTAPNLLESSGHWHGYQAFTFAASDFRHGAQLSAYGPTRTIDLERLSISLQIACVSAAVDETGPVTFCCSFARLQLNVQAVRGG